jgi:hypothetical protein
MEHFRSSGIQRENNGTQKADVGNGLQLISVPKGENPHFSRLPEVSTNMVESTFSVKIAIEKLLFPPLEET